MKEKIIELLLLCMQAKSQGVIVNMDYRAFVDGVHIYAFKDDSQLLPDEAPDFVLNKRIYLNREESSVILELEEAEQAVKNYVSEMIGGNEQ